MFDKKLNADYIKRSILPFDFYRHELPNAPLKKHDWNNGMVARFGDGQP